MELNPHPDRDRLRRLVTGEMDSERVTKADVGNIIRDEVSKSVRHDDKIREEVQRTLNLILRRVYNLDAKS